MEYLVDYTSPFLAIQNIHELFHYWIIPWEPFTLEDVVKNIELIKKQHLKLIGISTHDSGNKTIEAFKKAFSNEYKDLRIGDWIAVK